MSYLLFCFVVASDNLEFPRRVGSKIVRFGVRHVCNVPEVPRYLRVSRGRFVFVAVMRQACLPLNERLIRFAYVSFKNPMLPVLVVPLREALYDAENHHVPGDKSSSSDFVAAAPINGLWLSS